MNAKFYAYIQNNTGGFFKIEGEKGICQVVIIEAESSEKANDRAESIGLYFDGAWCGTDCPCCGDRWTEVQESEGYDAPSVFGESIDLVENVKWLDYAYIHYLNGDIKKLEFTT